MPINIPDGLPAGDILAAENIFVMRENQAIHQDIRPIRVLILNLMPTKMDTETQLLRLLGNTPLQVDVSFMRTITHDTKNTPKEHLERFYVSFEEVQNQRFDGFIITGAPVEHMAFESVDYWKELQQIMNWSLTHVFSTMHICWGAQAGLYHHYGVPKHDLEQKMFGVFEHTLSGNGHQLLRGFDDQFLAPHSRHTETRFADLQSIADLQVLSKSDLAGVYLVATADGRQVFITGHCEYDPGTLKLEYERDIRLGREISIPMNYFPDDDPTQAPRVQWRGHANLLFFNWLNYVIYQSVPYDWNTVK